MQWRRAGLLGGRAPSRAAPWQMPAEAMRPGEVGSNAIALGGDATQNGGGLLLGNPHQPWNGSGRWYEAHLTIPGEYDVAGASLQGLPWIGIGFTKDLAWTHTVDYSTRFTLYELKLNPENPLQYEYDGQWREITGETVAVQGDKCPMAAMTEEQKTFYSSHYGMIVDLGGVDPAAGGLAHVQWLAAEHPRRQPATPGSARRGSGSQKAQASDMTAEFAEALQGHRQPGVSRVRRGPARRCLLRAGLGGTAPHPGQARSLCQRDVGALLAQRHHQCHYRPGRQHAPTASGARMPTRPPAPTCSATTPARKSYRRRYVGNSNNSYWLSDASNPLTGYPVVLGWMGRRTSSSSCAPASPT